MRGSALFSHPIEFPGMRSIIGDPPRVELSFLFEAREQGIERALGDDLPCRVGQLENLQPVGFSPRKHAQDREFRRTFSKLNVPGDDFHRVIGIAKLPCYARQLR